MRSDKLATASASIRMTRRAVSQSFLSAISVVADSIIVVLYTDRRKSQSLFEYARGAD